MKANLKTAGIIAASAALLYFPLKRLIKALRSSPNEEGAKENATCTSPRQRKVHHRHLLANKAMNWH